MRRGPGEACRRVRRAAEAGRAPPHRPRLVTRGLSPHLLQEVYPFDEFPVLTHP